MDIESKIKTLNEKLFDNTEFRKQLIDLANKMIQSKKATQFEIMKMVVQETITELIRSGAWDKLVLDTFANAVNKGQISFSAMGKRPKGTRVIAPEGIYEIRHGGKG